MVKKSVEDLVIWREMFFIRRFYSREVLFLGYTEFIGYWFFFLVGMVIRFNMDN